MNAIADLVHVGNVAQWGAAATARIAPVRKHWQNAFGYRSRSETSRQYSGERAGPAAKVLEIIDRIARCNLLNPWPLIAEQITVVTQAEISKASTADLEARLDELDNVEDELEAAENRCTRRARVDRLAAANANIHEAEVQLERAAINRELWEREQRGN